MCLLPSPRNPPCDSPTDTLNISHLFGRKSSAFGVLILVAFAALALSAFCASTRCPGTLYYKSAPMYEFYSTVTVVRIFWNTNSDREKHI